MLALQLLRFPLGSRLVVARIHLQALRLWLQRRAPVHRKPPYDPEVGSIAPDATASSDAIAADGIPPSDSIVADELSTRSSA
jgi:hypothetical protein